MRPKCACVNECLSLKTIMKITLEIPPRSIYSRNYFKWSRLFAYKNFFVFYGLIREREREIVGDTARDEKAHAIKLKEF
jgi:hypothetical protein